LPASAELNRISSSAFDSNIRHSHEGICPFSNPNAHPHPHPHPACCCRVVDLFVYFDINKYYKGPVRDASQNPTGIGKGQSQSCKGNLSEYFKMLSKMWKSGTPETTTHRYRTTPIPRRIDQNSHHPLAFPALGHAKLVVGSELQSYNRRERCATKPAPKLLTHSSNDRQETQQPKPLTVLQSPCNTLTWSEKIVRGVRQFCTPSVLCVTGVLRVASSPVSIVSRRQAWQGMIYPPSTPPALFPFLFSFFFPPLISSVPDSIRCDRA
jgi:hypothetical protein